MLKLLKSVLLLVILCGGLHLIQGEQLNCEFEDEDYHVVGTLYSCVVTSLDNSFNNMTIEGYTGTQLANTNDSDINAIWIDNTNTKYIPADLGLLFKLTALLLARSQLVEIKSNDFRGMQSLEHLNLYGNKLTSVPSDVFSKLTKLKFISLDSNQIKYIGIGVFDKLTNLNEVFLDGNICVHEKYSNSTEIIRLKENIMENCVKQIDIIQKEIETKIKDEATKAIEKNEEKFNQMNQKMDLAMINNQRELRTINEMVKQLLKRSQDYQMERQEKLKLRTELTLAKDVLKIEQVQRDQLKKELTAVKAACINEREINSVY